MKILYDYQTFTSQHFGGVSKCFCEILSRYGKDILCEISIKQSKNIHLLESELVSNLDICKIDQIEFCKRFKFRGNSTLYKLFNKYIPLLPTAENVNQQYSIQKLKEGDFDIFHPTGLNSYFIPYIQDKPLVVTIHDMMPELYPQYYGKNNYQVIFKKKYLERATSIVAISENTKMDLVNMLKVPEEKIHVIYHGGPTYNICTDTPIFNCQYFLYVGTRNAYKNFTQTIIDFGKFAQKHNDVYLICTGPQFNNQEKIIINNNRLTGKVVHFFADDSQMNNLYSHALAFIFPSLYEGFGMPILESFAYGCPALLNNYSCFPEIAGDAALYFDSHNGKSDLVDLLEFVYANSWVRVDLIKRGIERLRNFSWDKSAKQLCSLYTSLL